MHSSADTPNQPAAPALVDPFTLAHLPPPAQAPLQSEGFLELPNGAKLWHWDTGEAGDVVVFAHPMSGNHASWAYQQPVFAAAGYRVIAYSRPGHAGSELGPVGDIGTQAGDLAAVMDALGVASAHIIGSAAGGSTALDFALSYPERTLSAVIASSLMSINEPDYQAASARARGPWFEPLPVEARELGPAYRARFPDGVEDWLAISRLNVPGRPRQPIQAVINWHTLAQNTVPLLLLTGDADLYLPPALLESVAARIPAATSLIIQNSGHATFWEQPDIFNAAVLEFLGRHA